MRLAGISRRIALGLAVALLAGGGPAASAQAAAPPAHEPDDMALGSPKARVTVIEYASVGCPHCAAWNNTIFPAIRAKYIATGKARLVVREMLTGEPTVAAAGFMLARCAGPAKYFPVIDAIYQRQASMFQPGNTPDAVLRGVASSVAGMSDAAYDTCTGDPKALAAVNARSDRHVNVDKVNSTPTFFVNGVRLQDELTLDVLGRAVRAAGRRR